MEYTIKEVSKKLNIPTSTLRYYDQQGLLPDLKRTEAGYRVFQEKDIQFLKIIECFKKTGMSISDIRKYVEMVQEGDSTLDKRYQLMLERKKTVEKEIDLLKQQMETINHKIQFYKDKIEKKN